MPESKILHTQFQRKDSSKIIRPNWLPWAMVAGLVILCSIFATKTGSLKDEVNRLAALRDQQKNELTSLQSSLDELRTKDRVSQVRIAMLNSLLESSPKAVAFSVWDAEKQDGVLLVQNLAVLPTDKDYQLWVIDPKHPAPVSAGVFSVDEKGTVRFRFKPTSAVMSADKFAVTVEKKGGAAAPQGKMVLAGTWL
ncbi:MAG: anti-sigma factor [Verrucomicrobiota bacterium]|nr:anti-sigma factor [Verrucomicrobiota bacterium]